MAVPASLRNTAPEIFGISSFRWLTHPSSGISHDQGKDGFGLLHGHAGFDPRIVKHVQDDLIEHRETAVTRRIVKDRMCQVLIVVHRAEPLQDFLNQAAFEQKFAFITALSEAWAVEASWRYRHEFEPLPGFEEGDSRFDISIVREF